MACGMHGLRHAWPAACMHACMYAAAVAACMPTWTGMHEPACMLLLQQLLLVKEVAAAACMRACVAARVIDTMYQLIYSSAQTRRGAGIYRCVENRIFV